MTTLSSSALPASRKQATHPVDHLGVAASILCAIHCALAPLLLIAAPTLGATWAHPASHWIVALAVVPLAGASLSSGWKRSPRWVKWAGFSGIVAICIGAALPYSGSGRQYAAPADKACVDLCCPSFATNTEGDASLLIPPASIVTTLGGLLLIAAHIGNLKACRCPGSCCRKPRSLSSA